MELLDARKRNPLALSLAPFALASALAWISVTIGSSIDWSLYAIATALLVLSGTLAALEGRGIWNTQWGTLVSAALFLAAVGLLRSAAGGINSGVAITALIPVFYTALVSEGRRQLAVVLAVLAAFYLVPILIVGPPAYPHTQYRAAVLTVVVSAIVGLATQQLVRSTRHQAAEALAREQMLMQVSELMRHLSGSTEARTEVCEAARRIGEACVAVLYEPLASGEMMRCTAIAGVETPPIEVSLERPGALSDAFRTGQARLITDAEERRVGSLQLWEAAGRPCSILYEPLRMEAQTLGVLAVGWRTPITSDGIEASIVALLAHEAAGVIARADTLSELTDMATTDPLTGLPNRRAWDRRLKRELKSNRPFTVAMLDLDHFKDFNDTYGHPAGDRLLKETATAWRDQLRAGDMLARLGGEEFGLLLSDCDGGYAIDAVERLRGLVREGQTCSAGLAERRVNESADAVLARADAALYEAKQGGRDRICTSV
jgi:diguanylate cyclase (GGDEF)-like protein